MLDITEIDDFGNITKILHIKYRFDGFDYLVADKYGNFYILPHCPNKRTIPFKIIGKNDNYVYYHGDKKYMKKLSGKKISVCEEYILPI
jgi:hypothetical protein